MLTMASTETKTLQLVLTDAAGNTVGPIQGVVWSSKVPGDVTLTPSADGSSCQIAAGTSVPGKTFVSAAVPGLPVAALDVVVTGPAVAAQIVVA